MMQFQNVYSGYSGSLFISESPIAILKIKKYVKISNI